MITFENLITAFHEAVLTANDTLKQKNAFILDEFFEQGDDVLTIKDNLQKLKRANSKKEMNKLIEDLSEQVDQEAIGKFNSSSKLKPKMVTIQYPRETENGHTTHDVHVPLISLVPVNQTGIEEVNITSVLELALKNDELMVSFPKRNGNNRNQQEDRHLSKIEIKLIPTTESDGLKKIIEGYDKVLRAQIPG